MAKIIRRESRQRGFFGWLFFIVFIAFNAIMALWLVSAIVAVSILPERATEAERIGSATGATAAISVIVLAWLVGAVITGLLAIITRGRRTIIEEAIQ